MERIKSILNNDKVGNAFFNLYDRWRDESEYEDINDYGKAIFNTIKGQYPDYDLTLLSTTKRPFGVKIQIGERKVHIFLKLRGAYFNLCAKLI